MDEINTLSSFPVFCTFRRHARGWTHHRAATGHGMVLNQGPPSRLFLDRCPHRGSAILNGRSNNNERLTCPYHGWMFGADGACLSGDNSRSLTRAYLVDLGGFMIGAPSEVALPPKLEAELRQFFSSLRISEIRVVAEMACRVEAPWRLWCENFLECKHCFANHPELRKTEAHIPPAHKGDHAAIVDVHERTQLELDRIGMMPPTQVFWGVDQEVPGFWDASLLAHSGHATRNRQATAPSLFESGLQTNVFFYGAIGPFVHFTVYSDYIFIHNVLPAGQDVTDISCMWLAMDSADTENLMWLWSNTIRQDIDLVQRLWAGRRGASEFEPLFAGEEYQAERFFRWHNSRFSSTWAAEPRAH